MLLKKTSIAVVGWFAPSYKPGSGELEQMPYWRTGYAPESFREILEHDNSVGGSSVGIRGPGTSPDTPNGATAECFYAACEALGQALAKQGHTIVLYIRTWEPKLCGDLPVCAADQLDRGEIPDELRQQCTQHDITLTDQSSVEVEQAGNRWTIDGSSNQRYVLIQREKQRLAIYGQPKTICDGVLEGANREISWTFRSPCDVILYVPRGSVDPLSYRCFSQMQHLQIRYVPRPAIRGYYPETFPSAHYSNAIILISGESLSEMVACVSHYVLDIPVVTITSFGGTADWMYQEIFSKEYEHYKVNSRVARYLQRLHEPWNQPVGTVDASKGHNGKGKKENAKESAENGSRAEEIVKLTEEFISQKRRKRNIETNGRKKLVRSTILLLWVWTVLFCLLVVGAQPENRGTSNVTTTSPIAQAVTQEGVQAGAQATEVAVEQTAEGQASEETEPSVDENNLWARLQRFVGWLLSFLSGLFMAVLNLLNVQGKIALAQTGILWALLFLMAVMGTKLKIAVAYLSGEILDLETEPSDVSLVAALGLSLGVALIYFIGGWSIAGKVQLPGAQENAQENAIVSAAVVLSILGLAAGFLLPIEEVRGRLRQFITPSGEANPEGSSK